MEESIDKRAREAIDEAIFPGCIVGIVRRDGQRFLFPFGRFTYDRESPPVDDDSLFDIASITKVIPTAVLALKLMGESKLDLYDRVERFLPELGNSHKNEIMVWHLLTHTLHYGFRLSAHRDSAPENLLHLLFTEEFLSPPGSVFSYSNGASILLGILVERVAGKRLDRLADELFFKPLQMARTSFHPRNKFPKEQIVPTEFDPWRNRMLQGEVHDESAFILNRIMVPGSAGLFSTAGDLLNFLEMLLKGGIYQHYRFFSRRIIEMIYTNQIASIRGCTGLGWELDQKVFMGTLCSKKTIGKTGFTGCSCVCDMEKGIGIVLLSNYTFPQRKSSRDPIDAVRRDIADIVFRESITGW